MPEKQGGLHPASNQPLSAEQPEFAPREQIQMLPAGFVGCYGFEWPISSTKIPYGAVGQLVCNV